MPIYEYRCKKCEKEFEALVYGSEKASCPGCKGKRLERLLSTFAAVSGAGAGASASGSASPGPVGACGSCGDPRGPGACSMN